MRDHGKTPSYTCCNESILPGLSGCGISRRLRVHDPARQRLENVERTLARVEAPSHARRWGTRREGAAVLDGQQGGMTYGAWRGTNVQSRVNWPSMPLRLVTLPFKVPADRTSSAISSTTWSPSEVALQSKAQPSSASWNTSSFVRAKRVPVGAGDPASSKRVP